MISVCHEILMPPRFNIREYPLRKVPVPRLARYALGQDLTLSMVVHISVDIGSPLAAPRREQRAAEALHGRGSQAHGHF